MTAVQHQLHAVFQSTMECVAAVWDELEPAFPDVAPHAAHFFRHGAVGSAKRVVARGAGAHASRRRRKGKMLSSRVATKTTITLSARQD